MDLGLMRLALRNLLLNAVQHSPPGTPVVVRIADSDQPLALLIDVVDQGRALMRNCCPGCSNAARKAGAATPATAWACIWCGASWSCMAARSSC
jgi:anti-sigma regulatory factor (Ser/Thr protein kinase)